MIKKLRTKSIIIIIKREDNLKFFIGQHEFQGYERKKRRGKEDITGNKSW